MKIMIRGFLLLFFTLLASSRVETLYSMEQEGEGLILPKGALQALPTTPPLTNQKKAQGIVDYMDKKRSYPDAMMIGKMFIKDAYTRKSQKMKLYSRGAIDTLIEMLDGESKGQKMLRTEFEVFVYMPDLDRQIRLSGSSLRQSFAGSDVSYEDLTTIKKTLENYNAYYLGKENAFGYNTDIVYLVEKSLSEGKGKTTQAYPIQKVWIDQKSYLPIRTESYSPSGKLLKEMNIIKYKIEGKFSVPTDMVIQDKLKKSTSTRVVFDSVDLHANITDKTFSLENLTF